tara:strand:+ start:1600 stop:3507 length:1908 start_codon:yes stop_codon:yes gene_type:complete
MHKILLIIIVFSNILFAQSLANISNLANQELENIKRELKNSSQEIEDEQIKIIDQESDEIILNDEERDEEAIVVSKYFGLDYFNKQVTFFDNLPTPSNYILGPGDEIIVSMWGETNSRDQFIINKEGLIYYPDIGFINLSSKTLEQAKLFLIEKLSDIYATLKNQDNPTTLMLELGSLKSINVYFSGQIKSPGVNLIHPFSDIFSAIIQAGGISENGSLRNIELIRNGEIVNRVDFYSFFIDGKNNFSNTKILDGDVIHIPTYINRVEIKGEVNQPHIYELLPEESLSHLIGYASGLTSNASSFLILNQIIPLEERVANDNARNSITINLKNKDSIILNNGDNIEILPIPSVDSGVTIYGRVKFPGNYPATNNTLKNILDIAGGFYDPTFRKSINEEIIVLRRDDNQFYSNELSVNYKEADKFQLEPNDKIFVYEDINYKQSLTYRIEGEVFRPGTYGVKKGLTVDKAIDLAGGLTEMATYTNIIVLQEFSSVDGSGNIITKYNTISNIDLDFQLGPNSVVRVLPYENVINVIGNVYNPGLISYQKNLTLAKAVFLAGGYKPYSMKKRVYVKRSNGGIEKVGLFRGRSKRLYAGDTVVVPVDPKPSDFEITTFISELSSTLANLAAILILIDNQN